MHSSLTLRDIRSCVDRNDPEFSLVEQCLILGINRSGIYYKPVDRLSVPWKLSEGYKARLKMVDDIYTEHPFYGTRRLAVALTKEGLTTSRSEAREILKDLNIQAIYCKPKAKVPGADKRVLPYLVRKASILYPDQVWSTDITYIPMKIGTGYLTTIIDWYSRYILAWEFSLSLESSFCLEAVKRALEISQPEIFNTDQGSHYTAVDFQALFAKYKTKISMDGKGRCFDNIIIERLWRSIKYEDLFINFYEDMADAHNCLDKYIKFYNTERYHSSLGYKTPEEVYYSKRNDNNTKELE
jgi:putative transposase